MTIDYKVYPVYASAVADLCIQLCHDAVLMQQHQRQISSVAPTTTSFDNSQSSEQYLQEAMERSRSVLYAMSADAPSGGAEMSDDGRSSHAHLDDDDATDGLSSYISSLFGDNFTYGCSSNELAYLCCAKGYVHHLMHDYSGALLMYTQAQNVWEDVYFLEHPSLSRDKNISSEAECCDGSNTDDEIYTSSNPMMRQICIPEYIEMMTTLIVLSKNESPIIRCPSLGTIPLDN